MLTGLPPFYDENTNEMYRKILTEPLTFPSDERIMPRAARELLKGLLERDPNKRLGKEGAWKIKEDPFFADIDWRKLLNRRYDPMFKPSVVSRAFSSLFRPVKLINDRLTKPTLAISIVNSHPRHLWIRTLKVLCSLRPCSSNLQAGRTTDLSRV